MTRPRIGVQYTPPPGQDIKTTVRAAREIEAMGYAAFTLPDHLTRPHDHGTAAVPDPFALLARIAADTTTIALGTMTVLDALRLPAHTVRSAVTLQQISGGRFELGIGAGWQPADLAVLAPTARPADARIRALEQTLQLLRQAWPLPGATTPDGRDGTLARTLADGAPAPRLIVAAGTSALLRLAARHADEVALTVPTRRRLHGVTPSAASVAAQIATARAARPPGVPPCGFHLQIRALGPAVPRDPDGDWWTVGGSPDEVADTLRRRAAAGVTHLGVCTEDLHLLEWLASRVLPLCEG
ncbi:LLM class flavin-dependent oxidoreductase [Streptomyces sp. NPDC001889]